MRENTFIHRLTKLVLDILIVTGSICTLGSFWLAKFLQDIAEYNTDMLTPITLTLFFSGSLSVYILFTLRMMFKTLLNNDPFVVKNVVAFRKIAISAFLIAVIYFVKCFYMFTYMTLAVCITFCIASLFCLTLKDVFKRAYLLRQENDLTI